MTIKKMTVIENLDKKIKQLEAKKQAEIAKLTQAERKRKLSILWSFGDMVEKALMAKDLSPEKLKTDLLKHLPAGAKRENAINAIEEILTGKNTDKKTTINSKKATENDQPKPTETGGKNS
jgi:hypothetical protein